MTSVYLNMIDEVCFIKLNKNIDKYVENAALCIWFDK